MRRLAQMRLAAFQTRNSGGAGCLIRIAKKSGAEVGVFPLVHD